MDQRGVILKYNKGTGKGVLHVYYGEDMKFSIWRNDVSEGYEPQVGDEVMFYTEDFMGEGKKEFGWNSLKLANPTSRLTGQRDGRL